MIIDDFDTMNVILIIFILLGVLFDMMKFFHRLIKVSLAVCPQVG